MGHDGPPPSNCGGCATFKHGQLSRLIPDYVREHAAGPITVDDLLPVTIGARELNHSDKEILRVSIHSVLNKLAKRRIVERMAPEGRTMRWRAAQSS